MGKGSMSSFRKYYIWEVFMIELQLRVDDRMLTTILYLVIFFAILYVYLQFSESNTYNGNSIVLDSAYTHQIIYAKYHGNPLFYILLKYVQREHQK